jgi:hypothetical protein
LPAYTFSLGCRRTKNHHRPLRCTPADRLIHPQFGFRDLGFIRRFSPSHHCELLQIPNCSEQDDSNENYLLDELADDHFLLLAAIYARNGWRIDASLAERVGTAVTFAVEESNESWFHSGISRFATARRSGP